MKKLYLFETQPDHMLVEKADDYHVAIRIGGRVALLDYDDWFKVRYLGDELFIDRKETPDNDLDIRTEYPTDQTREDPQTNSAELDWIDKKSGENYDSKVVL